MIHTAIEAVRVRRLPLVFEAVQVSFSNVGLVAEWIVQHGGAVGGLTYRESGPIGERGLWIGTLEGVMEAKVGWWVLRGSAGEFWPVREDVFSKSYERA